MLTFDEIRPEQLDDLAQLYADTFNAPPWNDHWTIATAKGRLQLMLQNPASCTLAAHQNGAPAGFVLGVREQYYDGLVVEIKEFCVRNDLRGQGIGSALYGQYQSRLQKAGILRVILTTLRGPQTQPFYQKQGFQEAHQLCIMSKTL